MPQIRPYLIPTSLKIDSIPFIFVTANAQFYCWGYYCDYDSIKLRARNTTKFESSHANRVNTTFGNRLQLAKNYNDVYTPDDLKLLLCHEVSINEQMNRKRPFWSRCYINNYRGMDNDYQRCQLPENNREYEQLDPRYTYMN